MKTREEIKDRALEILEEESAREFFHSLPEDVIISGSSAHR